jgi:hypothetical protein
MNLTSRKMVFWSKEKWLKHTGHSAKNGRLTLWGSTEEGWTFRAITQDTMLAGTNIQAI